jgi:hypothetical protein
LARGLDYGEYLFMKASRVVRIADSKLFAAHRLRHRKFSK